MRGVKIGLSKLRLHVCKYALVAALGVIMSAVYAESEIAAEDLPPWLQPDLLVHMVAMDLNEAQKIEFREALTECLRGLQQVVRREIQRGGVDIPKRIKRGTNRQYKNFDLRMRASLSDPQLVSWASYLAGLKVAMAQSAR
jgi:hypothetical protein